MLDISKDIHSLSTFKRDTNKLLSRMRKTGHPLALTINGKAELVVQDAAAYQKLLDQIDELQAVEGIKRGLADVAAGKVTPVANFEKEFARGMPYRVVLADAAKADAYAIYDRVVTAAPHRGPLWFEELMEHLLSLDRFPLRCPLAREAAKARREIRCLLFGKRRDVYRILYEVDEPRKTVWVLHIRHGARSDMNIEEIAVPE